MAESPAWRSDVTVVVVHPHASQVWVHRGTETVLRIRHDDHLWFPDVAPVLTHLRSAWNIDAIVLRCLDFGHDDDEHRCCLTFLVQPRTDVMPADGHWTSLSDVRQRPMADEHLWSLVTNEPRDAASPLSARRRPWASRGWFDQAVAWADAALRGNGREPTGPPEQLRTWGLSTVIRFPTASGDAYFKAAVYSGPDSADRVGFLFANEAALLGGLSARFPDHLPVPIAVDTDRVWMLLPDAGAFLAKTNGLDVWERAIRLHARHQRAYVGHAADLFQIGCVDRRLDRLAAQFDRLLHDESALAYLDQPDRDRLHAAASRLRGLIAELASLGIPDTLVHGDLHAQNIGVRDGRLITFDWTDACVAHPFLDLVTFTGESRFLDATPGARDRLNTAYLAEWRDFAAESALARAAEIIQPIGALHQAVSYQHMLACIEEPDRSSMGRGGAYWLRGALGCLAETQVE